MKKCFTPIKLGNLNLKNRFMMAPMENGLAAVGGGVTDRLCDFFAERAKNDVAIIMTGSIGVSPEGRGLPTQLSLYEEAHRDDLKKLVDRVHEAGAAIGAPAVPCRPAGVGGHYRVDACSSFRHALRHPWKPSQGDHFGRDGRHQAEVRAGVQMEHRSRF